MIDVLVVDDHPIFRAGLATALGDLEGVRVVGQVGSADEAVRAVVELGPQVVLMDVDLGDGSGIDATAAIARAHPEVAVLMLTMHDADAVLLAALNAGARGYLLKGADQEEIHRAVLAVAAGEALFGAGVARRILSAIPTQHPGPQAPQLTGLTEREREILELMAQGLPNGEIAKTLCLAPKTVRNNVSSILGKLQTGSRGEAIVRAREWGFGSRTDQPRT